MDEIAPDKPSTPSCWCVWQQVADERLQVLVAVHATRTGARKAFGQSSAYTIIEWDLAK